MSGLTAAGYSLDPDSEKWAQAFHEAYERLAPTFGYETRRESAVPWADVPAANKALMTAVAGYVVGDILRRADEARVAEGLTRLLRFTHAAMSSVPGATLDFDDLRFAEHVAAALPAPRPPEPDRTAELVSVLEKAAPDDPWVSVGHWCDDHHTECLACAAEPPADHEPDCWWVGARAALAATPEPDPVADGTEP